MELKEPEAFVKGYIDGVIFRLLTSYSDDRGWLAELYRDDELSAENCPVMAYISETLPGKSRGPHHHLEQTDCFAFIGPSEFTIYFWDIRQESLTWGNQQKIAFSLPDRQSVIVPPGIVHSYQNTGQVPGYIFNAPNRLYAGEGKGESVDEVRHENRTDNPYVMN